MGVGTTANLARRPAQVIMGLVLLLLLACPLMGVWIMGMERAPSQTLPQLYRRMRVRAMVRWLSASTTSVRFRYRRR